MGKKKNAGDKAPREHWKADPELHDFPAAEHYLSLVMPARTASAVAARLRAATTVHYQAKDLLRASRLPLLAADDAHVADDLAKVRAGALLSPVLLVRGDPTADRPLTIADGYHRVCASYHLADDADIPCRITELSVPSAHRRAPAKRAAPTPSA